MTEREYVVVLKLRTSEGNPAKWNWPEVLDVLDGEVELVGARPTDEEWPFCPACKRRLHRKLRQPLPCRVCERPVQYNGAGRPPFVHPECRGAHQKLRAEQADDK